MYNNLLNIMFFCNRIPKMPPICRKEQQNDLARCCTSLLFLLMFSVSSALVLYVFIIQLQEGHLVVRHFQFLRWSAYREIPDSKKAFLNLLAQVQKWQMECGEGRIVVHCL